jgi:probable rRNA maturation factor
MDSGDQRPGRARAIRAAVRPAITVEVSAAEAQSARGLGRWLVRVAPARARGVVSLAIVSDARVRALNRTYRGLDRATDVLSFPTTERANPLVPRRGRSQRRAPVSFLGDIVIARGVARRQAREAGHSERDELRVLALHGLLHLLGYDHERDQGTMARLERRLRTKGGLGEALLERSARVVGA